jgi:diguanylate cyclase (GGDEF)-like protein/PAS domain S-box-containing protein
LRTVHEVEVLSRAEAARAYPIELDAVVTYSDPEWGLLFAQDSTGAIFINVHGNIEKFPLDARIRVSGVSTEGDRGPAVKLPKVLVVGTGTLPAPKRLSVASLDAGEAESHRVVTEGILHNCEHDWNRVCFRLYDGQKNVWVVAPEQDSPAAQRLIGAVVRATGIAGLHEDDEHRRIGAELFINTLSDLEIQSPPSPVSFSSPPTLISNLRPSDADQRFASPIHLRGIVTWQSSELFALRDDSGTVFVGTGKPITVQTGGTVDAIGFPSHGRFGLELADSSVNPAAVQSNAGIEPLKLTAAEVVKRSLNGSRVRLKAHLIGQSADPAEFFYQLEEGSQRFNAILLRTNATHEIVGLSRDSVLELTGLALIRTGTKEWPGTLLILVESPNDIVMLRGYDWLTFRQRVTVFGITVACIFAALVWVIALRRTVRGQTATIRARLESELHLEKKYSRLVEGNLAAVFSWRPDGTVTDCNPAFARMLGFDSPEQLIGRSGRDFRIDPTQQGPPFGELLEEPVSNREVSLRRDDGTTLHLLMNITPVQTAGGILYETTAIDVTQLRQNQAELQGAKDLAVFESLNDPLTGLPNRKLLAQTLPALLAGAQAESEIIALLYLDLDGFKLINDSLGHAVGDALLVQVAARLRSWMRQRDMLARLGGDEFMVIMRAIRSREDAVIMAESLLEDISSSFEVKGHLVAIGASIGISVFPDDATDAEELIQQADSAMYVGRREGKNHVTCYTAEIGSQVNERLILEQLLRGAVARNEIAVHYQPEFELAGQRLTRFEALARWTHPVLGQIPPLKFIPIAEESGIIWALGAHIMQEACAEAVRWQKLMPYPIQVAVNVSSVQFRRKGFIEQVNAILQRTGLRPDLLQIEVTESIMLGGAHAVAETIDRLREMGISIAIDDFGTGYSSLSYLPTLAFDVLKIDRSFVANLESQPETEAMIRTLIGLAHNFGMRVIVEGVETQEQLAIIKALGANEVQGYLTGRPTANPAVYMFLPARL